MYPLCFFFISLNIKLWYVFFLFSRYFVANTAGIFVAYSLKTTTVLREEVYKLSSLTP